MRISISYYGWPDAKGSTVWAAVGTLFTWTHLPYWQSGQVGRWPGGSNCTACHVILCQINRKEGPSIRSHKILDQGALYLAANLSIGSSITIDGSLVIAFSTDFLSCSFYHEGREKGTLGQRELAKCATVDAQLWKNVIE